MIRMCCQWVGDAGGGGTAGFAGTTGTGSAQAMPRERTRGSATRRVAVVSLVVIAVIAGAGILSSWRYEAALSLGDVATDLRLYDRQLGFA